MRILNCLSAGFLFVVQFYCSIIVCTLQIALLCFKPFIPELLVHSGLQRLANIWWAYSQFCVECWGGVSFVFFGDSIPRLRSGIMMGNHQDGLDFMVGVCMIQRAGIGCGRMITFMKSVLKWFPMVGWINFLQGSVFLKRNWTKDRSLLESRFKQIKEVYPRPLWIGLYPEGTRQTPEKLRESQVFARNNNLSVLEHLLIPRSKGLTVVLDNLSNVVEHIYDFTVCYQDRPLYLSDCLFRGRFTTTRIFVHMRLHEVSKLPSDTKQWLFDKFVEKDHRLKMYTQSNSFAEKAKHVPPNSFTLFATFASFAFLFILNLSLFINWTSPVMVSITCLAVYTLCLSYLRQTISIRETVLLVEKLNKSQ